MAVARKPRSARREVTWIANASYLPTLPSFRSRMSRYKLLLGVVAVVAMAALQSSAQNTSARPQTVRDSVASPSPRHGV